MGTEQTTGVSCTGNRKGVLRCIAEKSRMDRVRNVEIQEELKQEWC